MRVHISDEKMQEVTALCELFLKNPDSRSVETYFRLSSELCALLRTEDIYPDFDLRGDYILFRYFKNGDLRHEVRADKKGIFTLK